MSTSQRRIKKRTLVRHLLQNGCTLRYGQKHEVWAGPAGEGIVPFGGGQKDLHPNCVTKVCRATGIPTP